MADIVTIMAEPREGVGKGPARALRRAGRVPAVIYGENEPQRMVSLGSRELRRALANARFFSTLCRLELGGETIQVLPREAQLHPVTESPLHLDFVRVSLGTTVTVTVPVAVINEDISPGLKRGGVLNLVRREIELICPADAIPGEITLDLGEMDIGDSLHISQVTLPEGVQPEIADRDFTIATISAPSVAEEEVEEEEGEEVEGEEGEGEEEGAAPTEE